MFNKKKEKLLVNKSVKQKGKKSVKREDKVE